VAAAEGDRTSLIHNPIQAVAQLDVRPVMVSGSSNETLRMWDLAAHARS
jgi:hypothetical protein